MKKRKRPRIQTNIIPHTLELIGTYAGMMRVALSLSFWVSELSCRAADLNSVSLGEDVVVIFLRELFDIT